MGLIEKFDVHRARLQLAEGNASAFTGWHTRPVTRAVRKYLDSVEYLDAAAEYLNDVERLDATEYLLLNGVPKEKQTLINIYLPVVISSCPRSNFLASTHLCGFEHLCGFVRFDSSVYRRLIRALSSFHFRPLCCRSRLKEDQNAELFTRSLNALSTSTLQFSIELH